MPASRKGSHILTDVLRVSFNFADWLAKLEFEDCWGNKYKLIHISNWGKQIKGGLQTVFGCVWLSIRVSAIIALYRGKISTYDKSSVATFESDVPPWQYMLYAAVALFDVLVGLSMTMHHFKKGSKVIESSGVGEDKYGISSPDDVSVMNPTFHTRVEAAAEREPIRTGALFALFFSVYVLSWGYYLITNFFFTTRLIGWTGQEDNEIAVNVIRYALGFPIAFLASHATMTTNASNMLQNFSDLVDHQSRAPSGRSLCSSMFETPERRRFVVLGLLTSILILGQMLFAVSKVEFIPPWVGWLLATAVAIGNLLTRARVLLEPAKWPKTLIQDPFIKNREKNAANTQYSESSCCNLITVSAAELYSRTSYNRMLELISYFVCFMFYIGTIFADNLDMTLNVMEFFFRSEHAILNNGEDKMSASKLGVTIALPLSFAFVMIQLFFINLPFKFLPLLEGGSLVRFASLLSWALRLTVRNLLTLQIFPNMWYALRSCCTPEVPTDKRGHPEYNAAFSLDRVEETAPLIGSSTPVYNAYDDQLHSYDYGATSPV